MNGYCVKCKSPKAIANAVEATLKNGRKALRGKCAACGTGMFKILGGKSKPAASSKTASAADKKTASAADKTESTPAPARSGFRLTFFHD